MFKFLVLIFLIIGTTAQATENKNPVDFQADEFTYNRNLNLVIARGHVLFRQGTTALRADHVNYSMVDNMVIASGNVEITSPDGGVMRSSYAKITGDLKEGFIQHIRYTLADKSVMTAKEAQHIQGNFTEFQDVAYSSCDFCKDGSRFWEIKAEKMTHDKTARDMTAHNATMTIDDVPVMYLPYFTYPDPSVKRRTGFLMPSFKSNRAMGQGFIVPMYWEVSPYTDITFSPWIATDGILWAGDFRHNFTEGRFNISGTYIEERYNVTGNFDWNINDVWRFKSNIDYTSDDTYLRRYDLRDDYAPWLTSEAAFEALTTNSYFYFGGFHYRNLREDVNDKTIPAVLPLMNFAYNTDPNENGGYFSFGTSSAVLNRDIGTDSARLSFETGYHLPGITNFGAVYDFNATAVVNGYKVNDYFIASENKLYNGEVMSFHPQASLKVSYPFVNVGEKYTQILEPIVMGVIAPNSTTSNKIPDEDSNDLDFDDTDLFSENRFVGYDRFEAGSRVNYGLKWSSYGQKHGSVSFLIGQSYRFSDRNSFPIDSGLHNQASDIVGRLTLQPNSFISLSYAFRMDNKNLDLNRSDLTFAVGNDLLRVSATYINLKSRLSEYSAYNNREELLYSLRSYLTRYWLVRFDQRINLSRGGGVLETSGVLRYEDECFAFETGLRKENTHDRDYEKGVTFVLGVEFKPFGAFNL